MRKSISTRQTQWYSIHVQPGLFGGIELMIRWGTMGHQHRSGRREFYENELDAQQRMDSLCRQRRRQGFISASTVQTPL